MCENEVNRMKELYTAPNAELLRFAAAENLADLENPFSNNDDTDGNEPV